MVKIIQIIVIAILIFLVVRLVRLILNYSAGVRSKLNKRENEQEEIRKHFDNIEEAEFRDITTEENGELKEKDNGR